LPSVVVVVVGLKSEIASNLRVDILEILTDDGAVIKALTRERHWSCGQCYENPHKMCSKICVNKLLKKIEEVLSTYGS